MAKLKSVYILVLAVLFAVFSFGCGNDPVTKIDDVLVGIWKLDSVTKYTFDGSGSGCMIVSDSEYKFSYTLKDDELKIDFISESAKDSTYEFYIDENKLTLLSKDDNKGSYELTKEN